MRTLVKWLLGIMLVVGGGCAVSQNKPDKDSAMADTAYAEGDFANAERLYREALDIDPDDARLLEKLGTLSLWKNDLAKAEFYLKAAQARQSWLSRRWPLNVQPRFRLATTYIRANKWQDAATLLNQAAGPWPVGPFKELKVRAEQAALFAEDNAYRIEGPGETDIPFVITDPLPVVKVSINGSAPANFFIDTGAEELVLDRAFASDVKATIVGDVKGEYAGGKKGLTGYGRVASVTLGDLRVRSVPISTVDLAPTSKSVFGGMEIKGIIGTRFLMQFLSTIDYSEQKLVLRQWGSKAQEGFLTSRAGWASIRIPFWWIESHLLL